MEFISRYIWQIDKNSQVFFANRLKNFRIGNGQLPMLMLLYNYRGLLNQEEISQRLNIDKAATARAVRILLEAGLISRQADPHDRRMFRISLTDKAHDLRGIFFNIVDEWHIIILNGFLKDDKEILLKYLEQMKNNSENYK
ncbi:MAG: MarR family transcriptional regulator [Brevinematales bacterium]